MAVFPPKDVQEDLRRRLDASPTLHKIPWGLPVTYHITLKFMGNVKNASIFEDVLLRSSSRHRSFELGLEGGGGFPSLSRPRVLWAGLTGDVEPLKALAVDLEQECAALGCPPENRKFSPHVTVARIDGLDLAAQGAFLEVMSTYRSTPFRVGEIHLVESRPSPLGASYSNLFSRSLAA